MFQVIVLQSIFADTGKLMIESNAENREDDLYTLCVSNITWSIINTCRTIYGMLFKFKGYLTNSNKTLLILNIVLYHLHWIGNLCIKL